MIMAVKEDTILGKIQDHFLLKELASIREALADTGFSTNRRNQSADNQSTTEYSTFIKDAITELNTKADSFDTQLKALDTKIDRKSDSLESKIVALDTKIDRKIDQIEKKIDTISDIRTEVKIVKAKQEDAEKRDQQRDQKMMWRYSFAVAVGAAVATIVKLFM